MRFAVPWRAGVPDVPTEVHCPICHRREHWLPDGEREVRLEGGGRRPPGSLVRAAFDQIAAAAGGEGETGIASVCVCGMPLLGPPASWSAPQATPYRLSLPQGEVVASGRTVKMGDEAVELSLLAPEVHAAFPAVERSDATVFERLFAGGLLTAMMVPAALWCVAVFVVFVFYRQWATNGVPVGP